MLGFHPTCPLPPVRQSWWVCVVLVHSRGWYLFSLSFAPPHFIHINFDEQGEGWNQTWNAFLKWYLVSQTPDLWKWHLSELQSWLEMTPFGKGVGRVEVSKMRSWLEAEHESYVKSFHTGGGKGGGSYHEILIRNRTWILCKVFSHKDWGGGGGVLLWDLDSKPNMSLM